MNRSELIKPVEYTKNIDGYRNTKFVDNTDLIEFLAEGILVYVDESKTYKTPCTETEFYIGIAKSKMPNGKIKEHSIAIIKEIFHHPPLNELFQPNREIVAAISVSGDYSGASCVELPGRIDHHELERRNELNFSFLNYKLFLTQAGIHLEESNNDQANKTDKISSLSFLLEKSLDYSVKKFMIWEPSVLDDPLMGPVRLMSNLNDSTNFLKDSLMNRREKLNLSEEEIDLIVKNAYTNVYDRVFEK